MLVITLLPFTDSDPVIETEPVNTCVFERLLPNTLDPELYITEELTVCTTRVCAVKVPFINADDAVIEFLTIKLSADDAVSALIAQLEVPNKLPVIPDVTLNEPVTVKLPVITADPVNGKMVDIVCVLRLPWSSATTIRVPVPASGGRANKLIPVPVP